jgi:hypothetical protein
LQCFCLEESKVAVEAYIENVIISAMGSEAIAVGHLDVS